MPNNNNRNDWSDLNNEHTNKMGNEQKTGNQKRTRSEQKNQNKQARQTNKVDQCCTDKKADF